jgi:hypothetical protein
MMQQNPDHGSIRSFKSLPARVQAADRPFLTAIREVAMIREGTDSQ